MTSAHDLLSDRRERLLLAKRVEERLQGDKARLDRLEACYDHVDATGFDGAERTLRGDLSDVEGLLELARGVQLA